MDLDADRREFIEAVMKPLGRDTAREELLEECLAVAATVPGLPDPGGSAETARRLLSSASGFRLRALLGFIVPLLALIVVAWSSVLGPPALRSLDEVLLANRISNSIGTMCCSHDGVPSLPWFDRKPANDEDYPVIERVIHSMPPEDRLLYVGDISKKSRIERWQMVHDRYPEDPAHYYAFALAYRKEHSAWPWDFVTEGEALDPENGWFRLVAGLDMAKSSLGVRPPRRITQEERLAARAEGRRIATADPDAPKRTEILAPARLAAAYTLIDEALEMPRLDDYNGRLNRIRFQAAPPPVNFSRHMLGHLMAFTPPESYSSPWDGFRALGVASSFSAAEAAKRGDRDALNLIRQRIARISTRLAGERRALLPQLYLRFMTRTACEGLTEAWATAGDPVQAGRFIAIAGAIHQKSPPSGSRPPDALSEHRGSGFLALREGFSRHPSSAPVTEPQLRGGRLAEYALYERFIAHLACLVFCTTTVFVLVRRAFEKRTLGFLPERLLGVLTLTDRIRILVLGSLLPFAVYIASTRILWLDPREFALSHTRFLLWLLQCLAFILAVILVTLDTAGRCLHRRAPMMAMRWRPRDQAWIFGWSALASIPVLSLMSRLERASDVGQAVFWFAAALLVAPSLARLLLSLVFVFAGKESRRLHRAILLRSLLPPLAVASLLIAFSIPLLQAEERYWVARIDFDARHPDYNMFSPEAEIDYASWIGQKVLKAAKAMQD